MENEKYYAGNRILGKNVSEEKMESITSETIGDNEALHVKILNANINGSGAGYTLALLTTAFGNPAGLANGIIGVYKDTTANKIYLISAYNGVFQGIQLTAVTS